MLDSTASVEDILKDELESLQRCLIASDLTEEETRQCVKEVFQDEKPWILFQILKTIAKFMLFLLKLLTAIILVYLIAVGHLPTQKVLFKHSQTLIYPFMRQIRLWTLPMIVKFPTITNVHEQQCLVHNPFYHPNVQACWPCEETKRIMDLTKLHNLSRDYVINEKPFITRDVMHQTVTFSDLQKLFKTHKKALKSGTTEFVIEGFNNGTLDDLFSTPHLFNQSELQIVWRISRVDAVRMIRKLFTKPHFVPKDSEVALQRFLLFSGPEASPFALPLTEFANVWITQGQGHRLITLKPTLTCENSCRSLSVLLQPNDVLYYNWQFYEAWSVSTKMSKELSVTFIDSFY